MMFIKYQFVLHDVCLCEYFTTIEQNNKLLPQLGRDKVIAEIDNVIKF